MAGILRSVAWRSTCRSLVTGNSRTTTATTTTTITATAARSSNCLTGNIASSNGAGLGNRCWSQVGRAMMMSSTPPPSSESGDVKHPPGSRTWVANKNPEVKHRKDAPPQRTRETPGYIERDIISRVVSIDAVRKTTKGGRVNRFRVLVVAGNGKGAAGFGTGKSDTVRKALQKAYAAARKRWVAIDMSLDHGVFTDVQGEHNNTKVLIRRCKPFNGLTAGPTVQGVLECFGIENATTKVIGRRNPATVVYATFDALRKHITPHEASEQLGREVVRVPPYRMPFEEYLEAKKQKGKGTQKKLQ